VIAMIKISQLPSSACRFSLKWFH